MTYHRAPSNIHLVRYLVIFTVPHDRIPSIAQWDPYLQPKDDTWAVSLGRDYGQIHSALVQESKRIFRI